MDNQHKLISGYRDLSQAEVNAMNNIKALASTVGELITELETITDIDKRWVSIAKTNLQQGFMAAVRAVAQPTTF